MAAFRSAFVWLLLALAAAAHPVAAGAAATGAPGDGSVAARAAAPAQLVVEFLDVGQGAAVLVTSPTGKRMLVDGGPPEQGPRLAEALRRRGVTGLDLLVVSHPHLDHVGGLPRALLVAPPSRVLHPDLPHPLATWQKLLDGWERSGVPLLRADSGRRIDLGGGASAQVLAPPAARLQSTRSDLNANSVILLIRHGAHSILLTGDAEPETERHLLATHGDLLAADVLQVPHHGSRHSSGGAFLAAVGAKHAVVSSGRGNDYGHPHGAVLNRLAAGRSRIYRTDQVGTVRVTTDGKALRVEAIGPEAEPAPNFLGSRRSKVYHRPGCRGAARILARNLITWASAAAAEAEGRRPARDCIAAPVRKETR